MAGMRNNFGTNHGWTTPRTQTWLFLELDILMHSNNMAWPQPLLSEKTKLWLAIGTMQHCLPYKPIQAWPTPSTPTSLANTPFDTLPLHVAMPSFLLSLTWHSRLGHDEAEIRRPIQTKCILTHTFQHSCIISNMSKREATNHNSINWYALQCNQQRLAIQGSEWHATHAVSFLKWPMQPMTSPSMNRMLCHQAWSAML